MLTRRVLSAIPSTLVAVGFAVSWLRTSVPRSLTEALGSGSLFWILGLVLSSLLVSVTEFLADPLHPRRWVMRAGIVSHICSAVFLAGYGVGVTMTSPAPPMITVGLVFGAVTIHLGRWRKIATEDVPLLARLERARAQGVE